MLRSDFWNARCAHKENGSLNRKSAGDFRNGFEPNRIAGNIDSAVGRIGKIKNKIGDGTTLGACRSLRGHSADAQHATIGSGELDGLPVGEANGICSDTGSACFGGENFFDFGNQGAARMIEIIEMMIVAQQHGIDATERSGRHCGTSELMKRDQSWLVLRWIECGVGEQPQAAKLQQGGGAADISDI
jgi:hypothetical protein